MMKFLNNTYVKLIVPSLLSIFLGICGSVVASGVYEGEFFKSNVCKTFLWIGIITLIISILLSIYYHKKEKTQQEETIALESEIKSANNKYNSLFKKYTAVLKAFSSFGCEFDSSSDKIYSIIEKAIQTKEIRLESWNKEIAYNFICESLYSLVCNLAEKGDNFSVSIITKHNTSTKGKNKCSYLMLSRYGKSKSKPRIYKTPIPQQEALRYYYGKIFESNNPEPSYLLSKEEIISKFFFRNETEKNKYSQYIGIPICCSGHNMSGLIQIIAHEDSILSTNMNEIKDMMDKELFVYTNYALLCEKIEKVFLIQ